METNIDYLKMVSRGCSDCIRSKRSKKSILKCPLLCNTKGTSEVKEHLFIPNGSLFVRKKTWTSGRAIKLMDQMDTYEGEIKEKARELKLFTPKQLSEVEEVAKGQSEDFLINYYILQSHELRFTFDFLDEDTGTFPFKGIYDDLQFSGNFYGALKEFIIDKQSTLFQDLYPEYPGRQWWRYRRDLAYKEYSIIADIYSNQVYPEPEELQLEECRKTLLKMDILCPDDTVKYVLDNLVQQDKNGIWKWTPPYQILVSENENGEISEERVPVVKNCPTFSLGNYTCKEFEWNIRYPGESANRNQLECTDYIINKTNNLSHSVEWMTPSSLYIEIENDIRNCKIPDVYKKALVTAFEESKKNAERIEASLREQVDTFCWIMTGNGLSLDKDGYKPTLRTGSILRQILEDTKQSLSPLSIIEKLDYSVQQKLYTVWMLIRTPVFHEVLKEDENSLEVLHEIRNKLESATGICHHDGLFLEYYDFMDRNMGMEINDWVDTYVYLVETRGLDDLYDIRRLPPYCPAHVRFVLSKIYENGDTHGSEVVHEIGHFHEQEDYLLTGRSWHYKYYVDNYGPNPADEFVDSLKESSESINCNRQVERYTRGVRLIRNGDGIFDWISDLYMKASRICGLEGDLYKLENEINVCKRAAIEAGICDAKLHVRVVSKLADFLVNNNYVRVDNPQDILGKKRVATNADEIIHSILKDAQLNWNKLDGVFFSKKGSPIMGSLLQDAFTKKDIDFREPVYQMLLKLANMKVSDPQSKRIQITDEPDKFDKNKRYTLMELLQTRFDQT